VVWWKGSGDGIRGQGAGVILANAVNLAVIDAASIMGLVVDGSRGNKDLWGDWCFVGRALTCGGTEGRLRGMEGIGWLTTTTVDDHLAWPR